MCAAIPKVSKVGALDAILNWEPCVEKCSLPQRPYNLNECNETIKLTLVNAFIIRLVVSFH